MPIRESDYDCTERLCGKCGEWWPETEEFFYAVKGKFHSPCRACILEQKHEAAATKPCSIPGCTNPRHRTRKGFYYAYCKEHQYGSVGYHAAKEALSEAQP